MARAFFQSRCLTQSLPTWSHGHRDFESCASAKSVRNTWEGLWTTLMLTAMQEEMWLAVPDLEKKVTSAEPLVTSPVPLLLPQWKVSWKSLHKQRGAWPSHSLSPACWRPSAMAFQSEVLGCVRDLYLTNELVSAADSACTQPTKSLQGLSLIKCKQV